MDNIKPRKPRKKEVKGKFFLMHTVEHAYWGGAAKGFVKAAPDAHGFPSQGRAIGSLKRLANSTRPIAGLTGRFKAQELILLNEDQVLSLYLAQDPTRVFADIAVQCRVSGEECCDAMKLKERAQDGSEHLTRLGVAEARYVAAKIKVQEAQARKQEAEAEFEQAAENRLRQLQSIRRELAAELDGVLEEIAEIES